MAWGAPGVWIMTLLERLRWSIDLLKTRTNSQHASLLPFVIFQDVDPESHQLFELGISICFGVCYCVEKFGDPRLSQVTLAFVFDLHVVPSVLDTGVSRQWIRLLQLPNRRSPSLALCVAMKQKHTSTSLSVRHSKASE
jgi:hypothetical protein